MARSEKLRAARDEQAAELDIDPTLIASKATLLSLAQSPSRTLPNLMKWQRELLPLD